MPGYPQPGGPAYAGFGIRLIAYLIDAVLATIIGFVIFFLIFVPFAALGVGSADEEFGSLLAGLGFCFGYCGLFAATLGYFTVTWGLWSTSPGKMIFGLRIVDGSGQRLGWSKAVLRTLGYFCSGLIFYIGFLLIAFDERKQGLHDKIADTFVVQG
ncbi:MAG: RDD family protein [Chloroflexi bacterium]|nr:RDD family protein [Chloroflexota bacterium]